MLAGADACHCDVCGYVCSGRFAGCAGVWARGPRVVTFTPRATSGVRRPRPSIPVVAPVPEERESPLAPTPSPSPGPAPRVDSALRDIRAELNELTRQIQQHNIALDRVIERMNFLPALEKLGTALPDHVVGEVRRELAGLPLLHEDLVAELRRTTSMVADVDAKLGRLTDEIVALPSGAHAADTDARPHRAKASPAQVFDQER
jgi:hypothetical protein